MISLDPAVAPTAALAAAPAAALAGLPGMDPVRLARLLHGATPVEAWEAVRSGTHPADPRRRFTAAARRTDADEVGEHYVRAGVSILLRGGPGYPSALVEDPGAPSVLFALGQISVAEDRPRVAVVGTGVPTPYGRQVASELAAELAAEGVAVVSGLAAGIAGAAHTGAVRCADPSAAPPVAVVGAGLDRPAPSRCRDVWDRIVTTGVAFSEAPLGTPPCRAIVRGHSRIIAGLSDVVVVVESHHGDDSIDTVEAAARRSIPVCAVPGSVRSRASDGTNQLLVDGCAPVRDVTDVLVAVGLACAGTRTPPARRRSDPAAAGDPGGSPRAR